MERQPPASRMDLSYIEAYHVHMAKRLISARLDEDLLRDVRRSFGAATDSDTLRQALELARDLEQMRRFLAKWGGKGGNEAFASLEPRRS